MNQLKVRNLVLGEGMPKICVPQCRNDLGRNKGAGRRDGETSCGFCRMERWIGMKT